MRQVDMSGDRWGPWNISLCFIYTPVFTLQIANNKRTSSLTPGRTIGVALLSHCVEKRRHSDWEGVDVICCYEFYKYLFHL